MMKFNMLIWQRSELLFFVLWLRFSTLQELPFMILLISFYEGDIIIIIRVQDEAKDECNNNDIIGIFRIYITILYFSARECTTVYRY